MKDSDVVYNVVKLFNRNNERIETFKSLTKVKGQAEYERYKGTLEALETTRDDMNIIFSEVLSERKVD